MANSDIEWLKSTEEGSLFEIYINRHVVGNGEPCHCRLGYFERMEVITSVRNVELCDFGNLCCDLGLLGFPP